MCWELPRPWWLMGRALLSLHVVIVSCLKWDLSSFSQQFLPCFLLIGTTTISKSVSCLLGYLFNWDWAGVLVLLSKYWSDAYKALFPFHTPRPVQCPSPFGVNSKAGAENTLICASILCHGGISWNSLLRILLWIQLHIVFYMQTSELGWNCIYFLLYGGSHWNGALSWFSWLWVLKPSYLVHVY